MPLVGLIDRLGDSVPWADVAKGKGDFEDPVPVLMALCQDREKYCDFSVTELKNDPYYVQMTRRYDYFEPMDKLSDRLFGTAFHALLEKGGVIAGHDKESGLELTVKGKKIGGTPDLIVHNPLSLWDYKTVTMGKLSMMSSGKTNAADEYGEQLNGYRYMYWKKKGKEIKTLMIRFIIRDWRFYEFRKKNFDYKLYPRNLIMPIKTRPMVKIAAWFDDRVARHVVAERVSDERLHSVGECDTWNGLRCEHFCPVNDVCHFRMKKRNGKQ